LLEEEQSASEDLEYARSILTARHLTNPAACRAFASWATGLANAMIEHSLLPVYRIGAIAWLARVALRDEGSIPDPDPERERQNEIKRRYEDAADESEAAEGGEEEGGPGRRGRR